MSLRPRIAIVEDDADQRESLQLWLNFKGYDVWGVESAETFYLQAGNQPVDVLLIDLGLPGEDGLQTIRYLRESVRHGIIITSARSRINDRLEGMGAGADYYLIKPVVPEELLLCIETLWQRMQEAAQTGGWVLRVSAQELQAPCGTVIKLTPSEALLLRHLAEHDEPVLKKDLLAHMGGDPKFADMHRLDAHLSRLRGKVKKMTETRLPISPSPGLRLKLDAPLTVL